MAYLREYDDQRQVICVGEDTRILVPNGWPILNEELMPSAEGVWFVEIRGHDEMRDKNLPRHAVWLSDEPYSETERVDECNIREIYLRRFRADVEQRARFARWDEICAAWERERSLELAAKVRDGDYLCFGLWPVVPGSVAEDYCLDFTDGDEDGLE